MSKQESYHPDENQITKAKSTVRKKKPWELWARRRVRSPWSKKEPQWHRQGRYGTKEIAEKVIEKRKTDVGGLLADIYEYEVRNSDEK